MFQEILRNSRSLGPSVRYHQVARVDKGGSAGLARLQGLKNDMLHKSKVYAIRRYGPALKGLEAQKRGENIRGN